MNKEKIFNNLNKSNVVGGVYFGCFTMQIVLIVIFFGFFKISEINIINLIIALLPVIMLVFYIAVKSFMKKSIYADENKFLTLKDYPYFRIALAGPLLFSVTIAMIISFSEARYYKLCVTSKCFHNLYEIYKIPLWLSGLSLALSGLVAAVYRSEETGEQIRRTDQQIKIANIKNNFDLFVKHQELFFGKLDKLISNYNVELIDSYNDLRIEVEHQELYSFLFLNSPENFVSYYITNNGFKEITDVFNSLIPEIYAESNFTNLNKKNNEVKGLFKVKFSSGIKTDKQIKLLTCFYIDMYSIIRVYNKSQS